MSSIDTLPAPVPSAGGAIPAVNIINAAIAIDDGDVSGFESYDAIDIARAFVILRGVDVQASSALRENWQVQFSHSDTSFGASRGNVNPDGDIVVHLTLVVFL